MKRNKTFSMRFTEKEFKELAIAALKETIRTGKKTTMSDIIRQALIGIGIRTNAEI